MIEYGSSDHEQLMKCLRSAQSVDEVTYPAPPQQALWPLDDDLPRSVACTIHQGPNVTSMDFHPSHHTLLTVGCSNGEISLWEVGMRRGWCQSHSSYGIWLLVQFYFRLVLLKIHQCL